MSEHERQICRAVDTERHRQLGALLHRGVRTMTQMLQTTLLVAMAYLLMLVLCT